MAVKLKTKRVNPTLTQSNMDDVGCNVAPSYSTATTAPPKTDTPPTTTGGGVVGGVLNDHTPPSPTISQENMNGSSNIVTPTPPNATEMEVNKDSTDTGETNKSGGRPVKPNIPPPTDPPPPIETGTKDEKETPTTDEVSGTNGTSNTTSDTAHEGSKPPRTPPTTPPSEDTVVEEEPPMTYGEWVEYQKQLEAEQRAEAERQAEIYRERAEADAQAAYLQNQATYGANAETMAQMGLTGGGYSDYFNSQAYAQKRADMQTAQANEAALKQQAQTTYAEGIRALEKDWMAYNESQSASKKATYNQLLGYAMDANSGLTENVIRAMGKSAGMSDAEIQEIIDTHNTTVENAKNEKAEAEGKQNATYSDNAYRGLLADVQNPNTYGNYTEAGIRSLGKQWGWSDEQIQEAVDIWSSTKKSTEILLDGEDISQYGAQAFISDIQSAIVQDGQVLFKNADGNYIACTREQVYETCLQNRNAGYMTDDEVKQIMTEYDRKLAYAKGEISTDTYYNATNGDENAQKVVETVMNAESLEANAQEKAKTEYGINYPGKVINISKDNLDIKEFGSYAGTGSNGKQDTYIKKIVEDARAGKIQAGQVIIANYGWQSSAGNMGYYMYIGDGIFVAVSDTDNPGLRSLYIPDGYGKDFFGNITKK